MQKDINRIYDIDMFGLVGMLQSEDRLRQYDGCTTAA
jgi:hypothetical protein